MLLLNYIIVIGIALSFLLASHILTRSDITSSKLFSVIMLYLTASQIFSYLTFSFNLNASNSEIWFFIFIFNNILFNYYFLFYIFQIYIKNKLVKILSVFVIILLTVLTLSILISPKGISSIINDSMNLLYHLGVLNTISIIIWSIIALVCIIGRRYILIPAVLTEIILRILLINNIGFPVYNIITTVLFIYFPYAIYRDFMNKREQTDFNMIYNINSVENLTFGYIYISERGFVAKNRFISEVFEKETCNFNEWIDNNIARFTNMKNNVFTKMEFEIGKSRYFFYVMKQNPSEYMKNESVIYLFNVTENEMLERVSQRYSEALYSESSERLYNYSYKQQMNDVRGFLKGFSHNSFNLISVITTGMQYVKEVMDNLEGEIFTDGSLDDKQERLKELYYTIENTLNLSDSGVKKLFETFQLLNNRISLVMNGGKSVFNINQALKQEIFFFIENTIAQYSIHVLTDFDEREKTISFNYENFATIIHDILKFLIDEVYEKRAPSLNIETIYTELNHSDIIFKIMINNFNSNKIDNILDNSVFLTEEHYAPLINALILAKSNGMTLVRVKGNGLAIKLTIYE